MTVEDTMPDLGQTRDCVTRAIAIIAEKPYKEIYDAINLLSENKKLGSGKVKQYMDFLPRTVHPERCSK